MSTSKIKKYWSEEADAWVDESYTSGGAIGGSICKACQQEVSELRFGYCSVCREDIEKADLHLAIDEFIKRKKEDISLNKGTWMGDMERYFEGMENVVKDLEKLLETLKEKEALANYDPGPCYRCHQWPCDCKEGPLMSRKI